VVLLGRQFELGGQIDRLHVGFFNAVAQHLVDGHDVQRAFVHGHSRLLELVDHHAAGAPASCR
jgi:hypothetical protein